MTPRCKNLIRFLTVCLAIFTAFSPSYSQTPQAFNYQAVARDLNQAPITNTAISVRISIVESANTSQILYAEKHQVTTSPIGLFNLLIGLGTTETGNFSGIDWSSGTYLLQVEMDVNGGTNYVNLGMAPLLSVPYALFAENAKNVDDADADPTNELQSLAIEGNVLSLSNGNSVNLPIPDSVGQVDADADPNNEIQSLTVTQTDETVNLGLSKGGGGVVFSVADQDNSSENEIQQLSLVGRGLSLSKNGGAIDLPVDDDADPGNEIQHLTMDGFSLNLDNGGGTVMLPRTAPQTLSLSGTNLSISDGNQVDLSTLQDGVDDADNDPQNEIQQLTLTTLLDGGIDNSTLYQLNLTGNSEPVTLPIPPYWNATYFLTEPPSIANVFTPYPVDVQSVITSNGLITQDIKANDLVLGDPEIQALHLFAAALHYDRPTGNDLGFQLTPEDLTYGATNYFDDVRTLLNKEKIEFINGGGFTSARLGGTSTGTLELFPGGGLGAYVSTGLSSQGGGEFYVNGQTSLNFRITHVSGFLENPWVGLMDNANNAKAGFFINSAGQGVVFADMKNFIMEDPEQPDKVISYVSLEGPEAAAYCRGTVQLTNGQAVVEFPEHFQKIISENSLTVMLMPLSGDSKGLAVVQKNQRGFTVQELWNGSGNYSFDWEVKAIRKGFENYEPVMDRETIMPAKRQ